MRKGWEVKKLGEVCNIVGGGTPSKSIKEYYGGDIPWATVRDMNSDVISNTEHKITLNAVKNSSTNIIPKNNVVIATRVGLGKVCMLENDTAINQDLKGITPKNSKTIFVPYLYHWLNSVGEYIKQNGTGATVQGVKIPFIESMLIPIPSLPEQQRIVAILDEAFDAIARAKENAEKNLLNTRELFDSYLKSVFANPGPGWKETTLVDVCAISSRLIDPRHSEYIDLLHIGGANIESRNGVLVDLKTAREEKLKSGKFLFDKTMVLYSKIRPYLMKVARPDFEGLCSADIYPLLPINNSTFRDYLYYLLLSPAFTLYAIQGSDRAGMPKVNREHLFGFKFFLPPFEMQTNIVTKLDALSAETKKLEAVYLKKLADLEELKKAILEKAFKGELTGGES